MLRPLRLPIRWAVVTSGVLVALWTTGPARADGADYARRGAFARLGLTLGVEQYAWLDALDATAAARSAARLAAPGGGDVVTGFSTTTFLGFDAGLGYRLGPRFAVDASFAWARADLYADVADRATAARVVRRKLRGVDLDTWIATVGGRLYAATGRLQPFALAGIGALMATPVGPDAVEEAYGFASRFGLGLDFYVTRSYAVSATLSYVLATGDTRGSDWIGFRTSVVWRD